MQSFKLQIKYQRLIASGQTCPRCQDTEAELDRAVSLLSQCLKPLNIAVDVQKLQLPLDEFLHSPLSSNQIVINGKPLENWLNAELGSSKCCGVCADNECRTVVIGQTVYESIPAELIIKASLMAVAQSLPVKMQHKVKFIRDH